MKNLLRSYVTFTRNEKTGIAVLATIAIVLILVRATMHLWVQPTPNTEKQAQLEQAWATYKQAHTTSTPKKGTTATALPDSIDLNNADSATLVLLNGIGPTTVTKIHERIRNKGAFTDIEQLREVGSFSVLQLKEIKERVYLRPVDTNSATLQH
jgi:DNA uptake protein ComE-like DNA-binding protein